MDGEDAPNKEISELTLRSNDFVLTRRCLTGAASHFLFPRFRL